MLSLREADESEARLGLATVLPGFDVQRFGRREVAAEAMHLRLLVEGITHRRVVPSTSRPSCIASAATSRRPKRCTSKPASTVASPNRVWRSSVSPQGQHAAALAALRRVLAEDRAPTERARILAPYVEVALAVDDLTAASAAATELTAIAGTSRMPFLHTLAAGASGAVALADGAAAAALNLLRTAWTTWCDLDVVYEAARSRVLIALACRELGDEDTALMDLRAARQTFAALGAEPDVARVDALLAPAARDASSPLTGREAQVLQLVAAGKTNRQIAEELVISEKTVARHISNIFGKISVSSRSAATGYAYEHGLA